MKTQLTMRSVFIVAFLIVMPCGSLWGGPSFFDDFSDGDFNDGSPVSWWWDANDPGERVITADGFTMRPNPGEFPWAAVLDESDEGAVYAGNTSIRAQFKMDNPVGDAYTGIIFRADHSGNYYSAGIAYNKLFLCWIANDQWQNSGWYQIQGYDWGRDEIIIEVDVNDITDFQGQPTSQLEVRAWLPGQVKPTQAQISIVDSKYGEGMTAIYSYGKPATFRWVQVISEATGPIVDFNGDGIVDSADMCIMVDNWGTDNLLCDISPMPWGDGIVDVQDLVVLAEHLFEDYRLVAHWKLDETTGNIAYDSVDGHDGTLYGEPIWQPNGGQVVGALELDGIDDYISTPFILNPRDGSFSAIAWIKGGGADQVVISQTGDFGQMWLGVDLSGNIITGFSGTYFGDLVSEAIITDGQWHHVGFVYDMDTLHRRLYVDGVLVTEDISAVSGAPSESDLHIGASKDLDTGSFFSGMIDEVRIYNQALSTKEIAALAQ